MQTKSNEQQNEAGKRAQSKSPLDAVSKELNADLFLFSGVINQNTAEIFTQQLETIAATRQKNLALILTSYGGDADAAFVIAKRIKIIYEKFYLFVFGPCKSAGTLISLGADEIIMSLRGELGPLDIQLAKDDELIQSGSGLDMFMAINYLNKQCFAAWETQFLSILRQSGGNISTKTAADIAASLSAQIISPITAQIDPVKLGEMQRAIEIAYHYGLMLGARSETVSHLINDYPSHSFVIDISRAQRIFDKVVRRPTAIELQLEDAVRERWSDYDPNECVRLPHPKGIITSLEKLMEEING